MKRKGRGEGRRKGKEEERESERGKVNGRRGRKAAEIGRKGKGERD